MRIRTPTDLGAAIRDRRTKLGLAQGALAQKVDVSRQWIVEVEKGQDESGDRSPAGHDPCTRNRVDDRDGRSGKEEPW
jgi:hypothetical protein